MANRVDGYFQGNLWRKKVTLKSIHLSGVAGKYDTWESVQSFGVFLENRQEEFGILVSLKILINAVSGVQKEKCDEAFYVLLQI